MKYQTVNLRKDYPGKIDDFSKARNHFLEQHEWVLFMADDEEVPEMLYRYLDRLTPEFPYYWVRRIQLLKDRYVPSWNPHFESSLVSNRVRFHGRLHEHVKPRHPHGTIDIPIIHNQPDAGASYQNPRWMDSQPYHVWMAVKKIVEVVRGR